MKRSQLLAIGLIAFALALFTQAPAAVLYGWFAPKAAQLDFYGLQGTLLHGSVSGVALSGKPVWQELKWDLHPLALLGLRLSADLESSTPAAVRLRASLTPWGTLTLSKVRASGSVRTLLNAVSQDFLPVEGQLSADLDSVRLADGKPRRAEGKIEIDGLSWTLAKDPLVLGNYRAVASTKQDQIGLTIESLTGPLQVQGLVTLAPDQSYQLDLHITPKPDAPPMLRALVQSLGPPDAQGGYRLLRTGKLS